MLSQPREFLCWYCNLRCWLNAMLAAAIAKLKGVAPYVILVLVLPGGLLMALWLWQHRRRKQTDGVRIERSRSSLILREPIEARCRR